VEAKAKKMKEEAEKARMTKDHRRKNAADLDLLKKDHTYDFTGRLLPVKQVKGDNLPNVILRGP